MPDAPPVASVPVLLLGAAPVTLDVHRCGFGSAQLKCGGAWFDLDRAAAFALIDALLDAASLSEMEAHACRVVTETLGPL